MAIITTAEYKTYAGISGSTDDTFIGLAITAAQDMAEKFTGRRFDAGNYVDTIDGNIGQESVQVKSWPINTLTSVEYRVGTTFQTFDADLYSVDTTNGIIWINNPAWGRVTGSADSWYGDGADWQSTSMGAGIGPSPRFPEGSFNIRVTYNGGYTSQTMPASLKWAMYQAVDLLFTNRAANPMLQSESIMAYSYTKGYRNGRSVSMEMIMADLFGSEVGRA
jgi:hypothetical protein